MPLKHGAKPGSKGFGDNIKAEMNAGKKQSQAVAIAYSEAKRTKRAAGGMVPSHDGGYLDGDTPGRADKVRTSSKAGSFIIPADVVSHYGEGNSKAGAKRLLEMFPPDENYNRRAGGGSVPDGKDVPVLLSHGEVELGPSRVYRAGKGNIKHGFQTLDQFILESRKRHIATLKKLPGPAK